MWVHCYKKYQGNRDTTRISSWYYAKKSWINSRVVQHLSFPAKFHFFSNRVSRLPCDRCRPPLARWRGRVPPSERPGRGPLSGTRPSGRRSCQTPGTDRACCQPCSGPPACIKMRKTFKGQGHDFRPFCWCCLKYSTWAQYEKGLANFFCFCEDIRAQDRNSRSCWLRGHTILALGNPPFSYFQNIAIGGYMKAHPIMHFGWLFLESLWETCKVCRRCQRSH